MTEVPVKLFSSRGRMGRLRYIGYGFVLNIIALSIFSVLGIIAAILIPLLAPDDTGAVMAVVIGVIGLPVLVINFLWAIQRCHDFNATGWWSLILLFPLAGLVLWFIPGSEAENHFGPSPPENGVGVVLAVALPLAGLVPVAGILAAIAIPAYNDYMDLANQERMIEQESERERQLLLQGGSRYQTE